MTGHGVGHYMLSKRENRVVLKGIVEFYTLLTLLEYHSCVLRCMALYRDACKVKDMCFKDRKAGYKGLKDTSHTFSCYFASECTHVIWFDKKKKSERKNQCACICDSVRSFLFLFTQLKYKVHLCVNKWTHLGQRPTIDEQTNSRSHDSWSMDVPIQQSITSSTAPHIYLIFHIQSVSGE